MIPVLAFATLFPALAAAIPCVQFDADYNLYAFGGEQDVALGASSAWSGESDEYRPGASAPSTPNSVR